MPFDGGLSPTTPRSRQVPMFGGTPNISDILNRNVEKMTDLHGRGNWGTGKDDGTSFKEEGGRYKIDQRIIDIMRTMEARRPRETWVAEDWEGKTYEFPSYEVACSRMTQQGVKCKRITRKYASASEKVAASSVACCGTVTSKSEGGTELGACFHVGAGLWVTCAHCVKKYNRSSRSDDPALWKSSSVSIYKDDEEQPASVIHVDLNLDVAILSCKLPAGTLRLGSSEDITLGSPVLVVGSPKGFENNVSEGIVGGKNRVVFWYQGAPEFIFTDAQVMPGSSGGPMISLESGGVVGMMELIIPAEGMYGLNAALPVEGIQDALARATKAP